MNLAVPFALFSAVREVSVISERASAVGLGIAPNTDSECARMATWNPEDVLEMQNVDEQGGSQGCSLGFVHVYQAGYQGENFWVRDMGYRHGPDVSFAIAPAAVLLPLSHCL